MGLQQATLGDVSQNMRDEPKDEFSQNGFGKQEEKITVYGDDCKESLVEILKDLGVEIRYCKRARMVQIKGMRNEDAWKNINDRSESELRERIRSKFQFEYLNAQGKSIVKPSKWSDTSWKTTLNSITFDAEYDSFIKDFLINKPKWDGVVRNENLLIELFEAEDTPLNRWVGKSIPLGCVQRAYEPGSKIDEMSVLIGEQGLGKSTYCEYLLPQHKYEDDDGLGWFSDGLKLQNSDKEKAEALQGRVIVEVSEMQGSTRADIEHLKAFITQRDDGTVRLAYRRNAEVMLRRCIIVGTSNSDSCLPNDPTGLRRFVPVALKKGTNVEAYMNENREQIWAEALHQYNEGERANLPRELMADQKEVAEEYRNKDELLEERVEKLDKDEMEGQPISAFVSKLCGKSEYDAGKGDEVRVAKALTNKGWVNRRESINGKRAKRWYLKG